MNGFMFAISLPAMILNFMIQIANIITDDVELLWSHGFVCLHIVMAH